MKRLTIAGLTLILTSCSSRDLPKFNTSSPTREEQKQTICYGDSTIEVKLHQAQLLFAEMVKYELQYDYIIRPKDLSECEQELFALLIKEKSFDPLFRSYRFDEREDEALKFLKEATADSLRREYKVSVTD